MIQEPQRNLKIEVEHLSWCESLEQTSDKTLDELAVGFTS